MRHRKADTDARRSGAGATNEPTWKWYKVLKWLEPYVSRNRLVGLVSMLPICNVSQILILVLRIN